MIIVNIDVDRYHARHGPKKCDSPRSRRAAPPSARRPDPAGDRPRADRGQPGLRVRLHLLLRRPPADRLASPEDPARRRRDRIRAAGILHLLSTRARRRGPAACSGGRDERRAADHPSGRTAPIRGRRSAAGRVASGRTGASDLGRRSAGDRHAARRFRGRSDQPKPVRPRTGFVCVQRSRSKV